MHERRRVLHRLLLVARRRILLPTKAGEPARVRRLAGLLHSRSKLLRGPLPSQRVLRQHPTEWLLGDRLQLRGSEQLLQRELPDGSARPSVCVSGTTRRRRCMQSRRRSVQVCIRLLRRRVQRVVEHVRRDHAKARQLPQVRRVMRLWLGLLQPGVREGVVSVDLQVSGEPTTKMGPRIAISSELHGSSALAFIAPSHLVTR